jgi:ribonuclease P protein component
MLKKENRIHLEKDFDKFFGLEFRRRGGRSASTKNLIVKAMLAPERSRVGFIVNNKVDKRAVVRNQLKRRLREIIQAFLPSLKRSVAFLVVVTPSAAKLDFAGLKAEMEKLLKQLNLL